MGSSSKFKIAIVTPTRGDRPLFTEQYHNIIKNQTVQPDEVIIVDYEPISKEKDLSTRYRKGIEEAVKRKCNVVFLWEDDDWYHPDYIKWMMSEWEKQGKPDVLGVEETYYYHLEINKYVHIRHDGRSSAFCVLLKLPYTYSYPPAHCIWFDLHLFKKHAQKFLNTKTIKFNNKIYAIGIKHGTGITGGSGHKTSSWYKKDGKLWLKENCSDNEIYNKISYQLKK